ncbi:MAG: hypothetical protein ABIN58_05610 [candidate division WOR-3 bacterium]
MKTNCWNPKRGFWVPLLVAFAALGSFSGCGGGGNGTVPPPPGRVIVEGEATVPNGTTRHSRGLTGFALAEAVIKAYRLQDVLSGNLSTPLAQGSTDRNGRYHLELAPSAIGGDVVLVAEKVVGNRTVRVSTLVADIPAEGRTGVLLDAATTLASEEVLRTAKELNLSDLSSNGFASVAQRVNQEVLSSLSSLDLTQVLPPKLGEGLRGQVGSAVRAIVQEQKDNLKGSTGDVATAKAIVQMLRDFGTSLLDMGKSEEITLTKAVEEQQKLFDNEVVQPTAEFAKRIDFPVRVLGFGNQWGGGGPSNLIGLPPGRYREETSPYGARILRRIGTTDNKTWIVESTLADTSGMSLTVTVQNPIPGFRADPAAGKYTFVVTKQGDSALRYEGALEVVQRDAQGNPTQITATITLNDRELRQPIRFNGSLEGTTRSRGRNGEPAYSQLTCSGTLTSPFGNLQVNQFTIRWFTSTQEGDRLREVSLSRAQVESTTSRPVTFSVEGVNLQFEDKNAQQGFDHVTPKQATISRISLQGENIQLTLSNLQATFVREAPHHPWEDVIILPKTVRAELAYTSPTLTLNGQLQATWENPQSGDSGGDLSKYPKGNLRFSGMAKPWVGRQGEVELNFTSTPDSNPPIVQLGITLNFGTQSLQGSMSLEPFSAGNEVRSRNHRADITHTPSGFKVEVRPKSANSEESRGQIKNSAGGKVADIGPASELGVDLGNTWIIRYIDSTFETVESIFPW